MAAVRHIRRRRRIPRAALSRVHFIPGACAAFPLRRSACARQAAQAWGYPHERSSGGTTSSRRGLRQKRGRRPLPAMLTTSNSISSTKSIRPSSPAKLRRTKLRSSRCRPSLRRSAAHIPQAGPRMGVRSIALRLWSGSMAKEGCSNFGLQRQRTFPELCREPPRALRRKALGVHPGPHCEHGGRQRRHPWIP